MSILKRLLPKNSKSLIRQPPPAQCYSWPESATGAKTPVLPPVSLPKSSFTSSSHFFKSFKDPPHIQNRLPEKPTDIKGLDQAAFPHLQRARANKMTTLASCEFLAVKFYPDNHFISKYRKSTVAFGNFNFPVNILNDKKLEDALNRYRSSKNGKYRTHTIFGSRKTPFSTAVGRGRFRKLVKQCLFEAIKGEDVNVVKGFYFIRHFKVPVSESDKKIVADTMAKAVKKLHDPKILKQIQTLTQKQNSGAPKITGARKTNTVAEERLPLYVKKLPFV